RHWTDIDWSSYVHDVIVGGRSIRYVDYGNGPPLILLHGLGGCWQWWLECLPALSRHSRVIGIDLPGFGHSDPLPASATMCDYASVVAPLVDELALSSVTVAGHSMGGVVTLALARARPASLERILLINAGGVPASRRQLGTIVLLMRLAFLALSRRTVQH